LATNQEKVVKAQHWVQQREPFLADFWEMLLTKKMQPGKPKLQTGPGKTLNYANNRLMQNVDA
jgi:hypothetical protein